MLVDFVVTGTLRGSAEEVTAQVRAALAALATMDLCVEVKATREPMTITIQPNNVLQATRG